MLLGNVQCHHELIGDLLGLDLPAASSPSTSSSRSVSSPATVAARLSADPAAQAGRLMLAAAEIADFDRARSFAVRAAGQTTDPIAKATLAHVGALADFAQGRLPAAGYLSKWRR